MPLRDLRRSLNDVRFDLGREVAYLTDSGKGGLVVLDLATKKARRVLDTLRDAKLKGAALGAKVEAVGKPGPADGLEADALK